MDVGNVMLDKIKKYLFFGGTFDSLDLGNVFHDVFGGLVDLVGVGINDDLNHRIYLIYYQRFIHPCIVFIHICYIISSIIFHLISNELSSNKLPSPHRKI